MDTPVAGPYDRSGSGQQQTPGAEICPENHIGNNGFSGAAGIGEGVSIWYP
jgi:hypothetical protein